jgi:hypothetical protein
MYEISKKFTNKDNSKSIEGKYSEIKLVSIKAIKGNIKDFVLDIKGKTDKGIESNDSYRISSIIGINDMDKSEININNILYFNEINDIEIIGSLVKNTPYSDFEFDVVFE